MKPQKRAPGAGRPAGEFGPKTHTISIRITEVQRNAFEHAKRLSGRSLGNEVVTRAYSTLGLPRRAEHIRELEALAGYTAENIEQFTGAKWIADSFTAQVVRTAADTVLSHFSRRWQSGDSIPEQLEQLTKVMPRELAEAYKDPIKLGVMQATGIIAWIESTHKNEPPNEWSNPDDPTDVRRRFFRDLIQNREAL